MEPFVTHTGRAVPLRRSNVDTDQIIPAVWLKRVSRDGFGEGLNEIFTAAGAEWRSAGCSMCLGMNPDTLEIGRASCRERVC